MSNIPAGAGALLGQRLGNYEIVALLALGGTAEIYLAKVGGDSGFEKYVVVKCLHDHLADDEEFVKMFLDEARLAANLNHSNIAQTTALGSYGNRYYMVMEYLTGLSLAMVIRRGGERMPGGVLPVSLSLNIVQQACAGLHYAHEHKQNGMPLNIVHRDISPQNLVLTFEGVVKVVDFGIAKAELRETQTKSGTIKGKFAYMSPEQCIATGVDRRTDVFALGIILHELLTGKRLFKRPNPYDTYQAVIDCKVLPPSKFNHSLDPAIDAIALKALAKDKENRFATAEEFGDTLLQYMHSKGAGGGPGEVAKFFDQHFQAEIDEHNNRMRELISGDPPATAEEDVRPTTPPSRTARPPAPAAPLSAAASGARPVALEPAKAVGGTIPSLVGGNANKPRPVAVAGPAKSASAGAIPSLAGAVRQPVTPVTPARPLPGAPQRESEPSEIIATADLILDEKSENGPGELSQFISDLKPGLGMAKPPTVEDWGEPEADPDDLPAENTRIEANPSGLLAALEAASAQQGKAPTRTNSGAEGEPAARPSAARFPDIANLATQLATDDQAPPPQAPPQFGAVRGDAPTQPPPMNFRAPSVPPITPSQPQPPAPAGPFNAPGPFDQSMPMGNSPNRPPSKPFGVPITPPPLAQPQGYAPPGGPAPGFNYPPGVQPPQQHPPANMPPPNWAMQNWQSEGTGPQRAMASSLGPPLSGQFHLPPGAQMMAPVGENYPRNVDWQAQANKPARAVPTWILALVFFVALAVALAITVAVRKALA